MNATGVTNISSKDLKSSQKSMLDDLIRPFLVVLGTLSFAARLLLDLARNVIVCAGLVLAYPLFFGSKPLGFEELQLIAQSESMHEMAFKLGMMLTFLRLLGRGGV